MRNYGDFRHTCIPHHNYMLITGNTLRHRNSLQFLWGKHLQCTIGLARLRFVVTPKAICNYLMSRIAIRIHKLPAFRATHSSAFISHAHILPIQHIKVFACENTRVIQNSKKFKKFHFWGIF